MMSDGELAFLQQSIASHKQKQVEEIAARDKEIHRLRLDVSTLQANLVNHQESYAQLKERLVKAMTEVEMNKSLVDAEKDRASRAVVARDQAESAVEIIRQERDSLRKRLADAETLVAAASQQRATLAELETALMHAREQVRMVNDSRGALEAQLAATVREMESCKQRAGGLEARVEALARERLASSEEAAEARQALAKQRTAHADEVAELRRELQRASDSVEAERVKRIRSEAEEAAARRADEEDRRQLAESRQREEAVQRRLKDNEDEGQALRQNVYAIKTVVDEKESQRQAELERRRALEVEVSKLQLQLEGATRATAEWRDKYDAVRAEG